MNRFKKAWRALTGRALTITGDSCGPSRDALSWMISGLSCDADIFRNLRLARQKCRALDGGEEPSDYVRKFLSELENNTVGSEGVVLQMKILETEDRVIHVADEKQFLTDYESRMTDRRANVVKRLRKLGADIPNPEPVKIIHETRAGATVLRGTPDIFACNQCESGWKEWTKKENCTVTKQLNFHELERLALRGAARDGEFIVRKVYGFKNAFGFSLQLIDPEWLDLNYNQALPNGNQVVMGVEFNEWREPIAFHIIKVRPQQWMSLGAMSGSSMNRERVDASEIVHLFVRERIDQSRGVPWFISVINRLKMLGKYEEAELLASLGAACKTGHYYNDLDPTAELPPGFERDADTGEFVERMTPGGVYVNKYGWKYESDNPTHPNGDYGEFRKGVLRGVAAGLPGSTYYGISQDLEAVNFSSMQGGDREAREAYMMIQNWFIPALHGNIFPDVLNAGLVSGQIQLPVSKFDKFNKPSWHGRRWRSIDPLKWIAGKVLEIENGITSRQRVIAESSGDDYETLMLELAYEDEFEDSLGLVFGGELKAAQAGQIYSESDGTDAGDEAAAKKVIAHVAGKMLSSQKNGASKTNGRTASRV
jgi:lambda family phage portal protein